MAEWRFSNLESSKIEFVARVQEQDIHCAGDHLAPYLCISLKLQEPISSPKGTAWCDVYAKRVAAIAVELSPTGQETDEPWIRTGFMPTRGRLVVSVMLSHTHIEVLSRNAEKNGEVCFYIRFDLLIQENNKNGAIPIWSDRRQLIKVDIVRWAEFTRLWGYPAKRFMPVSMQLPDGLDSNNEKALECWKTACEALSIAHEEWRRGNAQVVGSRLRDVADHALGTWYLLWHPDTKNIPSKWHQTFQEIGQKIPGFKTDNPKIPEGASSEIQYQSSWLVLLRDLHLLANPFHHRRLVPVYSTQDVDTLLTVATAILRGLPSFWIRFPKGNE